MRPLKRYRSLMSDNNYLFVLPGFYSGAARALDLSGVYDEGSYVYSDTEADADRRAVMTDIQSVIRDYMAAANELTGKKAGKD